MIYTRFSYFCSSFTNINNTVYFTENISKWQVCMESNNFIFLDIVQLQLFVLGFYYFTIGEC